MPFTGCRLLFVEGWPNDCNYRITSYNVCYTKLLREGMTAFSINSVGYVLGGEDADGTAYKDMYAYQPTTDTWSKVADFGGDKRSNAVAFVIDDIAYVCTGISNGSYPNDFYKFDPTEGSIGTWTELRKISDISDDSYDDDYDIIRTNSYNFV